MANNTKEIVIRGVLNYAKVLGKARPHTGLEKYNKGPYWSVDVTPDAKGRKDLEALGASDKLKEPSPKDKARVGNDTFLSLRLLENRTDGDKNPPPRVVDARGEPWAENKLIGNGSVGDVKVRVVDYGKGVQKGIYLQAIRVLDHVPYEIEDFAPLSEDDEFFSTPEEAPELSGPEPSNDLDDDIPY